MIYLLRHGLDDENYIGGWSDVDLIDKGIEQVNATVAKMLENNIKIKRVICSEVIRAKTTAKIVCEKYGIDDFDIDSVFNEQNKGLMNGMLKSEALVKYPEYMGNNVKIDTIYPEGESLINLYERVKEQLEYILNIEDDTLIVTHRGVINMIYYIFNNVELDMDKKKFGVKHATLHELDKENKSIRKVF